MKYLSLKKLCACLFFFVVTLNWPTSKEKGRRRMRPHNVVFCSPHVAYGRDVTFIHDHFRSHRKLGTSGVIFILQPMAAVRDPSCKQIQVVALVGNFHQCYPLVLRGLGSFRFIRDITNLGGLCDGLFNQRLRSGCFPRPGDSHCWMEDSKAFQRVRGKDHEDRSPGHRIVYGKSVNWNIA